MSKRAKLTADKARQRVISLEESIVSRESKLEQLKTRLARSTQPDEKLLTAQERLERRIALEKDQVQKLKRLLSRQTDDQNQDSSDYYGDEEIESLHRSFEEVRQDLSQVKMRLEHTDVPRDLPTRLNSFEERITRREEVATDLYGRLLNQENALDQERQTVRRLSRRIREQDQNLDALREAVEDSVVATVDLVERLEELEENRSESSSEEDAPNPLLEQLELLRNRLEELEERLESAEGRNNSEEILMDALDDFDTRLESIELLARQNSEEFVRFTSEERVAVPVCFDPPAPREASFEGEPPLEASPAETTAQEQRIDWLPATFAGGAGGRLAARWEVAKFQAKKNGK
ncbi:MAG: hypothetical protein WC314_19575 [Vulcanimicrobiota bacterium]